MNSAMPKIRIDLLHRRNTLEHGALIGRRPTPDEAIQGITNLCRRLRVNQSGASTQDLDGRPIEGNSLLARQRPNPPDQLLVETTNG